MTAERESDRDRARGSSGGSELAGEAQLDRFLADVEGRAFRIARAVLRDQEDALDVVQDAMFGLVDRYASRPEPEWRPLFYRILNSRIRDVQRRRTLTRRLFSWTGRMGASEDEPDPLEDAASTGMDDPSDRLAMGGALVRLEQVMGEMPARQREAFSMRVLEGLDVAETAKAMKCSRGSVKTHLSRALARMKEELGEHWDE